MKRQKPTQARHSRKLSDAILARRYLDLQRLRAQVREAEMVCERRTMTSGRKIPRPEHSH